MPLLAVDNLTVSFPTADGTVQAVRGLSFSVDTGKTLGVVGESGSGKSVSALTMLGLNPGADITGSALFNGEELLTMGPHDLRRIRGAERKKRRKRKVKGNAKIKRESRIRGG